MEFIIGVFASAILIAITVAIHYEILFFTWRLLPKLEIKPRHKILVLMGAIFTAHTLAVWVYGVFYWLATQYLNIGVLETQAGDYINDFMSCIYFSASTYSSLGFGDIIPTGELRLITGVEVLNGLVLIGWSASFTYLVMQKFWETNQRSS